MTYTYDAAWVPFTADRTLQQAAAIAITWAEKQASEHGRPAVLVADRIGEYHGVEPFDRYRRGRHFSPRSNRCTFIPGAVIAHAPTPDALALAARLADGSALVVVEHPAPWRLSGWAKAVKARDLLTGEVDHLDEQLHEQLQEIVWYGNNGYARGAGREGARHILQELHDRNLLDPDLILSALGAYGVSPKEQETLKQLIDRM